MLAFAIHYLNGWAMAAADGARKEQIEWPPHPDRVFMALAAAWFETGEDEAEGAALRWLETQPCPSIAASNAIARSPVVTYVPVNDTRMGSKLPNGNDLAELKKAGLSVLPEFRSRQPRGFPVAVLDDPTVHLIWSDVESGEHRIALERLATKVTYVGHSASLVQLWLEPEPPPPNLLPDNGVAAQRLRVPGEGRLDGLARRLNRSAWIEFHDLAASIKEEKEVAKDLKTPPRADWDGFPDAVLLANESRVKQHDAYTAAKTGDAEAASELVSDLVDEAGMDAIQALVSRVCETDTPLFVSAHAYERQGINAIPAALAELFSERLALGFESAIVQTNVVSHTGADGYGRLSRQARFDGKVEKGREYVLVDDFIGQGGTLANLHGHIKRKGGRVVGAVALTGKPYSVKLAPTQEQLDELRQRHGKGLEKWWREHFGHPFDRLTQSEARYLARSPDADTIRNRLAAAKQAGGGAGSARSPREQKRYIAKLEARKEERFPHGSPRSLYPEPARWQGYARADKTSITTSPVGIFDPRLIVLSLSGKRLSLTATLRLTAALRGALLKACRVKPQPEWFCGHRPDGAPTSDAHLALMPLPFVGSEHADGRILGVALALPGGLDAAEAGRCLEPFLFDSETGLIREQKLFDGRWFECAAELEVRDRPPVSLISEPWTRATPIWASVTPVVLDRHYDGKDKWQRAAEGVKDACEHIGLPRPREVRLHPVSAVMGVPHAREFPHITRRSDGGKRYHTHVTMLFDEPVQGPVLIGAGRFRGYGLCRPLNGDKQGIRDE